MNTQVIIPFRLREGADFRRAANLEIVHAWWYGHGYEPVTVSDGLEGDAQFNRHRAYNRAVEQFPETDVFVFTEADMLVLPDQIKLAVRLATRRPGLVVPFTQYRYLSDDTTGTVRDSYYDLTTEELTRLWGMSVYEPESLFQIEPESTMDDGKSIGAVNIVSREALDITGGFTEATSGNWYDDNIIEEGFACLTGNKTRFVPGPAVHLYHLPGHKGDHLSAKDRLATDANKRILMQMRREIRSNRRATVRNLMQVRR